MLKNDFEENSRKKYKLYKDKRFIAAFLATTTLLTAGSIYHIRKKNTELRQSTSMEIGYRDVPLFTNMITNQVTEGNFVLLNIGNHNTDGVYFLNKKLEYCNNNNIDVGLIVTPNSTTLIDVYLDLEFVKEVLTNYSITYPVYLDVDCFLDRDDLTLIEANTLIEAFLKKAQENHIYIGIYGKQENMLEEYNSYHQFVTDDQSSKTIFQEGQLLYANADLKKTIANGEYHNSSLFQEDEYLIYKEDTSLKKISQEYGISINDLRKYNHLYFPMQQPKEGQMLYIPSANYQENRHVNSKQATNLGIDVSLWQGEINWQEVETNFAIIQVRDFINDQNDPMFQKNVSGCLENQIPMGFYAFSRATTLEGIQEEARYMVEQLKGIPTTYPVYLDLETDFWNSLSNTEELKVQDTLYTKEQSKTFITSFLQIWEYELLKNGFVPGIYCNQSLYQNLNQVTDGYLDHFSCWVAGGKYYDQEMNITSLEDLSSIPNEEKVRMKQVSSKGKMTGITGEVDINYCYLENTEDYTPNHHFFLRFNHELKMGEFLIGSGGIILLIHQKKRKSKSKKK